MERMRWMLFAVLLMGMAGTLAELLLTGHYEERWQLAPVGLLTGGLIVAGIAAVRPWRPLVAVMQALMLLFIPAGLFGTWLHYESNAEFAAELSPGLTGFALFADAITRPTPPPLAPGTMILLGLIGLICSKLKTEN